MDTKNILDAEQGLDFVDNDRKLYSELLYSFINDKPFDSAHLEKLVAQNNFEEAAKYIHLFKGAAAQLGAKQLASDAELLYEVLRGKTQGDTQALIQQFVSSYEKTIAAVRETHRKLQ